MPRKKGSSAREPMLFQVEDPFSKLRAAASKATDPVESEQGCLACTGRLRLRARALPVPASVLRACACFRVSCLRSAPSSCD